MASQIINRLTTKTITNVTIFKLLPHGYLVKTQDKQFGLVRARELTWKDSKNWRKLYKIGEKVQVVPLKINNNSVEFSARLVERDPWDEVRSKYTVGMLVTAVVTNVMDNTIWLELEPGVNGVLNRNELPDWFKKDADFQDCFWPNDLVNLTISEIEFHERKISLSLTDARKLQDQAQSELTPTYYNIEKQELNNKAVLDLSKIPSKNIWIVEDDEAQRNSISRWLKRQNFQVCSFESAEDCLVELEKSQCDILFSDVSLHEMDGFELVNHISEKYPEIVCAIMTDLFRINQSDGIAFAIDKGNAILCKPILPEDIADFLTRLHEGTLKNRQIRKNKLASSSQTSFIKKSDQKEKKKVLYTLLRKTNSEHVILFSLDPLTRKVSIISTVGHLAKNKHAIPNLVHSPVRDVAEDDELVWIEDSKKRSDYSQYLSAYIDFGSCLGIPVPSDSNDLFALFLFHSKTNFFIHIHEDYAESAAFRLSALIEKENILKQMETMQKLAMMGNLSRAMVHEINHRLGPVGFAIEDLEENCSYLQSAMENGSTHLGETIENTIGFINELTSGMEGLVKTAKLFGDLTAQSEVQLTNLDDVISQVVWIIRDLARDYKTIIHWESYDKLRLTRINPSHLKQILLNIMTNSLQHIDVIRNNKRAFKGHIFVDLREANTPNGEQYQISIRDNGPGIHQSIKKKIFEIGYTLGKPDGNGLGLFISQNLINSVSGSIFVKESIRYWGTTMCIQLPIV